MVDAHEELVEIRQRHFLVAALFEKIKKDSEFIERTNEETKRNAEAAWQFWKDIKGERKVDDDVLQFDPLWTPGHYYGLDEWQKEVFEKNYVWPADESWNVRNCGDWCIYKQKCYIEWLFKTSAVDGGETW